MKTCLRAALWRNPNRNCPFAGMDYKMSKINKMITGSQLSIVLFLFLLGSVTKVYIPVVVTLSVGLALSFAALIFFLNAKKRYEEICLSFARMDEAAKNIVNRSEVA